MGWLFFLPLPETRGFLGENMRLEGCMAERPLKEEVCNNVGKVDKSFERESRGLTGRCID